MRRAVKDIYVLLLTARPKNAGVLINYPPAFSAYLKDRNRDTVEYVRLILSHSDRLKKE